MRYRTDMERVATHSFRMHERVVDEILFYRNQGPRRLVIYSIGKRYIPMLLSFILIALGTHKRSPCAWMAGPHNASFPGDRLLACRGPLD